MDDLHTSVLCDGTEILISVCDLQLVKSGRLAVHRYKHSRHDSYTVHVYWNRQRLHRVLMGLAAGDGLQVDHINGNTLDNRRSNLRVCNASNNQWNRPGLGGSSLFKGVSYKKRERKWEARIQANRKMHWLGQFNSEVDAARAYDAAAIQLHGEYARLNFPEHHAHLHESKRPAFSSRG